MGLSRMILYEQVNRLGVEFEIPRRFEMLDVAANEELEGE